MKRFLQFSVFTLIFFAAISISCKHNDGDIVCTSIFATVGVDVNGGTLDDFFTIRILTNDTIRFPNGYYQNTYTVLDDNYQHLLENKQETFKFIGIKSGNKVVDETFIISADKCHINKVSGVNSVTI